MNKKTYKINSWGQEYEVYLKKNSYRDNGSLAIQIFDASDGCPFAVLTVNLEETPWCYTHVKDKESVAFVDTNNNPWAEEFIKNESGLCNYYLVEVVVEDKHFNMNVKKEFKWLRMIDNPNNEVSEFICWVPALLLGGTVFCCNGAFSLSIIEEGDLVDFDKCPLKEGNFGVNVYNKSIGAQNPM